MPISDVGEEKADLKPVSLILIVIKIQIGAASPRSAYAGGEGDLVFHSCHSCFLLRPLLDKSWKRSLLFQINQNKLPLRSVDPRLISRGTPQDFTPAFADFSRQVPGGRGAPVSYINSYALLQAVVYALFKIPKIFYQKVFSHSKILIFQPIQV